MVCTACGMEPADGFRFCPHCGKALNSEPSLSESSGPSTKVQPATDAPTGEPTPAKQEADGGTIRPGTLVFGLFSAITCVAAIGKGFPPIYILEAVGWAGAAWYWQRKRTHSELAKGIVMILAVVVAIGEVAHIVIQADSKSAAVKSSGDNPYAAIMSGGSDSSTAAKGKGPYAGFSVTPTSAGNSETSKCPAALPAGVDAKPLSEYESSNLVGIFGNLISKQAPWPAPDDVLLWDADFGFANKTKSCISMVVVELDLEHGGVLSKERHSVVLDSLGPGQATDAYVSLKIRTTARSEPVALLGWRTISISGFKP